MDNRPIGVFDSSVGGISVLRELRRMMPAEHYLYLGDTRNAPYGVRTESDILSLTRNAVDVLVAKDIKALLIACNTATSAAADALRRQLPIPVVGMEPALKPAALGAGDGRVAVLATPATLRQTKFQALFKRYGQHADAIPCAGLMEFVERLELDSEALDGYLRDALMPGGPYAAVVLGCTHYVFLRRAISRAAPGAVLYDGNEGTAKQMQSVLAARGALAEDGPGSILMYTTGDEHEMRPVMEHLLNAPCDR